MTFCVYDSQVYFVRIIWEYVNVIFPSHLTLLVLGSIDIQCTNHYCNGWKLVGFKLHVHLLVGALSGRAFSFPCINVDSSAPVLFSHCHYLWCSDYPCCSHVWAGPFGPSSVTFNKKSFSKNLFLDKNVQSGNQLLLPGVVFPLSRKQYLAIRI